MTKTNISLVFNGYIMGDIPKFDQFSNSLVPAVSNTCLVTRQKFADMIGLPVGVVNAWADRGYLPLYPLGRYSLVNLSLLHKQCLDKEFSL